MRFPVARLTAFVESVFTAAGAKPEHAATVAARLIEADLRGRTGHGLMRVRPFAQRVIAGGVNLDPDIRAVHETPVSALIDGDNGLGPVVMTEAAEIAIEKARQTGLAWVGTRTSNHAGAAGVYPALALREGMGGIYMAVAAGNAMPPWGGVERLLGTNPLAVAIPAGEGPPFQLDIATTVASHGTIRVKAVAGEQLPEGWVVDREGNPITDPDKAGDGYLMPIGGYKGSGLNIMIGLIAGVMNGAAFGSDVIGHSDPESTPSNTGQTFIVFRPDVLGPMDEFQTRMDAKLSELRASGEVGSVVRLPGERAVEVEAEQRRDGIDVPPPLLSDLRNFATELDLADRLE